jgi:2-dehydropantoate 2-reductase
VRILIYGAGVIGSLYGARLEEAGHDVTVLARGRRVADLAREGIVLEDVRTGARKRIWVHVADRLAPEEPWDLVIVAVPKQAVAALLPDLRANEATPSILFMVNTADRLGHWIEAVGRERFLAGFPGAGGERTGTVVRYTMFPPVLQPTTLGVPGARVPARLRPIAAAFRDAGFPVAVRPRIEDWQRTHAALMTPIAQALYAAGGDLATLARSPELLDLLVRSVRENFSALEMDGVQLRPRRLASLGHAPAPFLKALLRRALGTPFARDAVAAHALASRAEVRALATELQEVAEGCWLLAEASQALDDAAAAAPEGEVR